MTLLCPTSSALSWTAQWLKLNTKNSIVPPRSGHVAFGMDNNNHHRKVYVFGGYAEEESAENRYPTNDLWMLDISATTAAATATEDGNSGLEWTLIQPPATSEEDSSEAAQQHPHQQPQQRLAAAAVTVTVTTAAGTAAAESDTNTTTSSSSSSFGLVLGGWDSQQAGTGGVILQDLQLYDADSNSWTAFENGLLQPTSRLCAVTLDGNGDENENENDGSSSSSSPTVLVHNHRCTDHVMLLQFHNNNHNNNTSSASRSSDSEQMVMMPPPPALIRQPTTGTAPSPRGLHAMARLKGTNSHKVVLFGGAAQDGNMSNQVFILDTHTWEWIPVVVDYCTTPAAPAGANGDDDDDTGTTTTSTGAATAATTAASGGVVAPTPRASPCLVSIDSKTCVLFGGASRTPTGLHGCSDTWLLEFVDEDKKDGDDDDDNDAPRRMRAKWTQLYADTDFAGGSVSIDDECVGVGVSPPGRNAATLTPIARPPRGSLIGDDDGADDDEDDNDVDVSEGTTQHYFLLSGGWYPFRTTYNDNFVLKVTNTKGD